jgi:glycosyltransferase involved in cell wall biosynthesis
MRNNLAYNSVPEIESILFQKRSTKSPHPVSAPKPEILFLTSYPPRECGIATYSQDLLKALENKFSHSFSLKVCALESGNAQLQYPKEVKYVLDTTDAAQYVALADTINSDPRIKFVLIQHEFGFFENGGEAAFLQFMYVITKPIVLVFHTVLPRPNAILRANVRRIASVCAAIVVMTKNAEQILHTEYGLPSEKTSVIPHGTHLVPHLNKDDLKAKYGLSGRKVLATFGLLSSGKSIETTLLAMPDIIEQNPDITFLVIGKTHPTVVKSQGEAYRNALEAQVKSLQITEHVQFINQYLPLQDLLEYLQLTDIYLFTSNDPNQAVSGTFSYAMSCGCPIISTPIPHAREVLHEDSGIIIDFQNSEQLAAAVNRLMGDEALRTEFSASALQHIVPSAWENSAIAHAQLLQKIQTQLLEAEQYQVMFSNRKRQPEKITLQYEIPKISLEHVKKMTTKSGMIQFSKINQPDLESGYTLDDNARAMIALCMHYELTREESDLPYLKIYLDFIQFCQKPEGYFLNYVDQDQLFTPQNDETNLADSNGRAIWALGFLISKRAVLPPEMIAQAESILEAAIDRIPGMHSTRAMAFTIKGLYFCNLESKSSKHSELIKTLANRLVQMYRHEAEPGWHWFESYLTYANSLLPEALLCAYQETGDILYKNIAKASLDFLLSRIFNEKGIAVISNKTWLHKKHSALPASPGGEQPIDVAYTMLALNRFYEVFEDPQYQEKMTIAFNWFLGANHLNQIIYNPCTGGCYDGLEDRHVNLNQGAESTLSYLIARLTIEKQEYLMLQ